MLITLKNKLKQNELIVNFGKKIKVVNFSKKKRHSLMPCFKVNCVNVDISSEYKYLGYILNNNLTDSSELEIIFSNFNNSTRMLLRKLTTIELRLN